MTVITITILSYIFVSIDERELTLFMLIYCFVIRVNIQSDETYFLYP